jgi:hypothetical protein
MPELDDLENLADDIRASAPQPREQFVARLDKRVEAGFPKQRTKKEAGWFWRPTLALAACALLTLRRRRRRAERATATSPRSRAAAGSVAPSAAPATPELSTRDRRTPAPLDQATPETRSAAGEGDENLSGTFMTSPPGNRFAPGRPDRRLVERSTTLELETDGDEFADATAGVLRVADATGTIVQRSNVAESDGKGLATFDLRVPPPVWTTSCATSPSSARSPPRGVQRRHHRVVRVRRGPAAGRARRAPGAAAGAEPGRRRERGRRPARADRPGPGAHRARRARRAPGTRPRRPREGRGDRPLDRGAQRRRGLDAARRARRRGPRARGRRWASR